MKNIAIFASGDGSNAQRLIDHFKNSEKARIAVVVSNNPSAFVLERAKQAGIPALIINKESFNKGETTRDLQSMNIDLIVLAGFLWLIPKDLIEAFPGRIINIHPALLPSYGGKGMYGMNVHRSVCEACETETGITIHFVNEHYDSGAIILQERCPVFPSDTPEIVAGRVRELEHRHFPLAVERLIDSL